MTKDPKKLIILPSGPLRFKKPREQHSMVSLRRILDWPRTFSITGVKRAQGGDEESATYMFKSSKWSWASGDALTSAERDTNAHKLNEGLTKQVRAMNDALTKPMRAHDFVSKLPIPLPLADVARSPTRPGLRAPVREFRSWRRHHSTWLEDATKAMSDASASALDAYAAKSATEKLFSRVGGHLMMLEWPTKLVWQLDTAGTESDIRMRMEFPAAMAQSCPRVIKTGFSIGIDERASLAPDQFLNAAAMAAALAAATALGLYISDLSTRLSIEVSVRNVDDPNTPVEPFLVVFSDGFWKLPSHEYRYISGPGILNAKIPGVSVQRHLGRNDGS